MENIKFQLSVGRRSVEPRDMLRHEYNTSSIYKVDLNKDDVNKLVNCCGCKIMTTKQCREGYEKCCGNDGYVYSNPIIPNNL